MSLQPKHTEGLTKTNRVSLPEIPCMANGILMFWNILASASAAVPAGNGFLFCLLQTSNLNATPGEDSISPGICSSYVCPYIHSPRRIRIQEQAFFL